MAPRNEPPVRSSRPVKSILKKSGSTENARAFQKKESDSLFASTKKDKRIIKHAQLMSKVAKASAKTPKRRRPNKKLVTTLDSLAAALPDDVDEPTSGAAGSNPQDQVNIIKRKSMKSKPGAMKRREKLDQSERDRFAKNMAQLGGSGAAGSDGVEKPVSASEKLAALRGFISQTLETKAEFQKAKG